MRLPPARRDLRRRRQCRRRVEGASLRPPLVVLRSAPDGYTAGRLGVAVNRKLVVFVPADALDAVRDAVFAAGAGRIGDYERCSWYTEGTGTFRALEGASPTVG